MENATMTVGDFITITLLLIAILSVVITLVKGANERSKSQGKQDEINKNTKAEIQEIKEDGKATREELREDIKATRTAVNQVQLDVSGIKARLDAFINK